MKILIDEIERFIKYNKYYKGYSEETIRTYKLNLNEAFKYIEIKREKDKKYILDLMPYRLKIQKKSKKTIYKKVSIVKSFVKYLEKNGYKIKLFNDENIMQPKTLPKPISHENIKKVLQKLEIEDRLIIYLLYGLGLRISELENLKIKSIKKSWVEIKGKGDKIRYLPILKSIKEVIETYIKERSREVYIFEKDGKKLSSNQIRYKLSKIFKGYGLKVTPHQLRHSFATEMLNSGASIVDVSKLLGHKNLDSTQIYTKLATKYKRDSYDNSHPLSKESFIV